MRNFRILSKKTNNANLLGVSLVDKQRILNILNIIATNSEYSKKVSLGLIRFSDIIFKVKRSTANWEV